jgi:hypothetical protein
MSDTPRTDAHAIKWENYLVADPIPTREQPVEWYEFCRTLERELAAMTKERDELRRHADAIVDVFGEPYEFLDVDSEWVQRMDKVIAAYRASQQPKP